MEIAGLIVGVLGLIGLLAFVPRARDYLDRRRHVRDVRARLEPVWQVTESTDLVTAKVLTAVRLVVLNSGRWYVRELLVLGPPCVATEHRNELAAGETWALDVPLHRAREQYDHPVVLQLVDVRGRMWRWTPAVEELNPIPAPLPPQARLVQWVARRVCPSLVHRALVRAPKSVQRFLCTPKAPHRAAL